jgi:hypothetical protein
MGTQTSPEVLQTAKYEDNTLRISEMMKRMSSKNID